MKNIHQFSANKIDIRVGLNIVLLYDFLPKSDKNLLYGFITSKNLIKMLKNIKHYPQLPNLLAYIVNLDRQNKLWLMPMYAYIRKHKLGKDYKNLFKEFARNVGRGYSYLLPEEQYHPSQIELFDNQIKYERFRTTIDKNTFFNQIVSDSLYYRIKFIERYFEVKKEEYQKYLYELKRQEQYPKNKEAEALKKLYSDVYYLYRNKFKRKAKFFKKYVNSNIERKIIRWRKTKKIDYKRYQGLYSKYKRVKDLYYRLKRVEELKEAKKKFIERILKAKAKQNKYFNRYLNFLKDIETDIAEKRDKKTIVLKLRHFTLREVWKLHQKKHISKREYAILKTKYEKILKYLFAKKVSKKVVKKVAKKVVKKVSQKISTRQFIYEIREYIRDNNIQVVNGFIKCSDYLAFVKDIYPDLMLGEYMNIWVKLWINITIKWFGILKEKPILKFRKKKINKYYVFMGYEMRKTSGSMDENDKFVRGYIWITAFGSEETIIKNLYQPIDIITNYRKQLKIENLLDQMENDRMVALNHYIASYFGIYIP